MSPDLLSVALALVGAFLFGVSNLVARQGLLYGNAQLGSVISIGTTAVMYWLMLPLFLAEAVWHWDLLWRFVAIFAAIGLFSPSISLFLSMEGTRRLGPTVSGTLAGTAPLFGAGSAVLVLGEHWTLGTAIGTAAIVAGVMVLSWRGTGRRDWPLWAVLLPLGAALFRGCVQMYSKFGFELAPAPFMGALSTFTASFVVVLIGYRLLGAPHQQRTLRDGLLRGGPGRGGLRWFALTGILNGLALLALYAALSIGRVVVVSPMVSTYPLFTFALSLLFRVERLGLRVFIGVTLCVSGVIAVAT